MRRALTFLTNELNPGKKKKKPNQKPQISQQIKTHVNKNLTELQGKNKIRNLTMRVVIILGDAWKAN